MERIFSKKERRTYEHLCCLTERGIIQMMSMFLKSRYKEVITTSAYIIAVGDIPIGLCAHADTVFTKPPNPNEFYYDQEKNVIWNSDGAGADDRAGIFAIIDIIRHYPNLKPYIFITTGEETFCVGSNKLCLNYPTFPYKLKYLIQLDRRGHNDSVYYDCANDEFEAYINKFGFITARGSYTDISILAPHFKCAAVNLSIGYEDEHSQIERLFVSHMFETIEKVAAILLDEQNAPYFEYKERIINSPYNYKDGEVICNNCLKSTPIEEALPLYSLENNKHINICLDCYAKWYNHIAWCKNCYKGFLFNEEIDVNKQYLCDECNPKKIKYAGLKNLKN